MTVPKLFNLAQMSSFTTGTWPVTLALNTLGYNTFIDAGAVNGDTVRYVIYEAGNREYGHGILAISGATIILNRVLQSSTTGLLLNLQGAAIVSLTPGAEDFCRTGAFTLNVSATSTTVADATCTTDSVVLPMPSTANAALSVPSMWISAGVGSFTVQHANNAFVDRTFNYVIR